MLEYDVFQQILRDFGAPANAVRVSADVAETFRDRLPAKVIEFWRSYGLGSWKNGYMWLCDPRPFDPLLQLLFESDAEFKASNLTVVAYTAFCQLKVWDKEGKTVLVHLRDSKVFAQSIANTIDTDTGESFSKDFLASLLIQDELELDTEYYDLAVERLGRPLQGEIFGSIPALQLGGDNGIENLHRLRAVEHMNFLAQLEPLKLTRLSPPGPGFPYGQDEFVRFIGRRSV